MSADSPYPEPYPAPFDTASFIFPEEWRSLSDLLGGTDTGVLFLQNDMIIHVSQNLADQLGYAEAELVGRPVESLFPRGQSGIPATESPAHRLRFERKKGPPVDYELILNRIDTRTNASCTIWVVQPVAHRAAQDVLSADPLLTQAIVDHLPNLIFACDTDSSLRYASPSCGEVLGIASDDLAGQKLSDLAHQEDRPRLLTALASAAAGEAGTTAPPVVFRIRHSDGSWRHLSIRTRNLMAHPAVSGLLLNGQDVTDQVLQQQTVSLEKKRQLHYFNRLFRMSQRPHANLSSALTVALKATAKALSAHRCAYWNVGANVASAHCVMTYDDVRQNFIDQHQEISTLPSFGKLMDQLAQDGQHLVVDDVDLDPRTALYCEYFHETATKALIVMPVWHAQKVTGLLVICCTRHAREWRKDEADFASNVAGLISLIFEEMERTKAEAQLRHMAHHDSLTGLPNRHFLFDQAAELFPTKAPHPKSLAAFFIDLDGFKNINDTLGHAIGDELLKAAARRLRNAVRKDDILVRLGGDEFMLLARNLSDMRIADDIAQQIVETMRGVFSLQGHELRISASIGIAFYPFDGADIDTLMKKADIAMYHAKSAGRDRYQMFAPRLSDSPISRSSLDDELRRALEEDEFEHYYQPQVDLRTGKVRCVEALLRWRHPEHGVLLPASFLPQAEESGMLRQITAWMLNDVCRQLRRWTEQGLDHLHIAVNLSSSQLMDRALLPALESAIDRSGIDGNRLEWEIKESTVMQHNTMTSSMLERVTDMNISLSIDDFGTGYTNMSHLRRYPVHKLKINGNLVGGLPADGDDRAVADAIIAMARPLGLDVVAENVETAQQMDFLRAHGCDIAQGFYFTPPLSAEHFGAWLTRH